ncbi:hypothetical protein [Streptomyces sp. bgisy060]|uniref:hypothetical protein n=1 Tax=Streptomyces sp. bgisy060 TaxID=3413775 RepID=UPI003EBF7608
MGAHDPLAHTKLSVEEVQQFLDSVKPWAVTELPEPGQASIEPGGGVHTGR